MAGSTLTSAPAQPPAARSTTPTPSATTLRHLLITASPSLCVLIFAQPCFDAMNVVLRTRYGLGITEAIPHAPDRFDARLGELGGDELAAQASDVDVDRPGLDEAVAAPHEVQQLLAP